MTGPDRSRAQAAYRRLAASYDRRVRLYEGMRRRAVRRLSPQPGATVVDLGCGTGLSFDLIENAIGPSGRLIRPWSHLDRLVPDLHLESALLGGAYIASGKLPE